MGQLNPARRMVPTVIAALLGCLIQSVSPETSSQVTIMAAKKFGDTQIQLFGTSLPPLQSEWTSGPIVSGKVVRFDPGANVLARRVFSSDAPATGIAPNSYIEAWDLLSQRRSQLFPTRDLESAIAKAYPAGALQRMRGRVVGEMQVTLDLTTAAALHNRIDDCVDLWVIDATGRTYIKVSDGDNYDEMPVWSPDGSKLAFYRTPSRIGHGWDSGPQARGYALWLWDRRTGKAHEIAPAGKFADLAHLPPGWSTDGSKILLNTGYDFMKERLGVYIVGRDGQGLRCLNEQDTGSMTTTSSYEFSPDGRQVLYTWRGAVCLVNADGTNRRVILSPPPYYYHASWSSEGARIVVMDHNFSWAVANPDGTNPQPIVPPQGYIIYKAYVVD